MEKRHSSIVFFIVACISMTPSSVNAASRASTSVSTMITQQQTTITGTIFDKQGQPVIGATIAVKGAKGVGTVTDINGHFTLNTQEGNTLIISYIGYKTVEAKAFYGMKVTLAEDVGTLSDVVVVGYGTQKKANLTGAVANVNVDEAIASRPITDVAKALQGVTPGLTITNLTGGIGTESTIRLRGSIGSLSATGGTSPLILVDNVEVPDLNLVNPDDIATISVLKDAASSSIYGTRAAWGVILITTKQGSKNEKTRVSYS
ncbi:MAG: carboxypeptidase-like regulatory domain-containing protein, partial [Prevotella sp.]